MRILSFLPRTVTVISFQFVISKGISLSLFFEKVTFSTSTILAARFVSHFCERFYVFTRVGIRIKYPRSLPRSWFRKGRRRFDTNLSNQEGARWDTKVAGATEVPREDVRRCHVSRKTHYAVGAYAGARAREEGVVFKGQNLVRYFCESRKPRSDAV